MKEFITTSKLGSLFYDKILFEGSYPILFTLKDKFDEVYICVCHHMDANRTCWLLAKSSPSDVIMLLTNKITIRKVFLLHRDVRYSIVKTGKQISIEENTYNEWNEDSIYLPDDVYMDAEDGEFEEEILYYSKFLNDSIDFLYSTLEPSDKMAVKSHLMELLQKGA